MFDGKEDGEMMTQTVGNGDTVVRHWELML